MKKNLCSIFLFVFTFVFSQTEGSLDETFNPLDRGREGPNGSISEVDSQSDGKILILGSGSYGENVVIGGIARLNTNGKLDTSFSLNSINDQIFSITVSNDDKILLLGSFTQINGVTRNRIARLNPNGSLDTSFDAGIGPNSSVFDAKIQNDGKILIYGSFTSINGTSRNSIARLNVDGTLDTTFNVGTGTTYGGPNEETIYDLTIQPDGKIIICGTFLSYNGTPSRCIARINSNGSIDSSFDIGMGPNYYISTLAIQSNGKLIISGAFTTFNGTSVNQMIRLNTNGSLDTTFNSGNLTSANMMNPVSKIVVQNDDKLIFCGALQTINGVTKNKIVRLNIDGSIDESFDIGSGFLQTSAYNNINWGMYDLKILNNNKIIVGGNCETYNGITQRKIALLNPNGSLDNLFNTSYGTNNLIHTIAIQPDGKSIIGGEFTRYYNSNIPYFTRIDNVGNIDPLFNIGSGPNGAIYNVKLQNDSKILVSGSFTTFNGVSKKYIVRLNSNGSLDNSFNYEEPSYLTNANFFGWDFVLQPDDKKLIFAGSILLRLNANGSLDTNFNFNLGTPGVIQSVCLQPDGKILIGGNFGVFSKIKRLNIDGSVDITFNSPIQSDVSSITILNDNKILICVFNSLLKLNNDGSVDYSFEITNIFNINKMKLHGNKIIVHGDFSLNGFKNIAIFNLDGSFVSSFFMFKDLYNGQNSITGLVSDIAIQTDGKIIAVGKFTHYNNIYKDNILRINSNILSNESFSLFNNKDTILFPNPSEQFVTFENINKSKDKFIFTIFDLTGRLVHSGSSKFNEQINIESLESGNYIIQIQTDNNEIISQKIIKN
jgi:uncharacterized delta-60 repeat protein